MKTTKSTFIVFILAAAWSFMLVSTGCKSPDTSTRKEDRLFLASFALIDLTSQLGGNAYAAPNHYKQNLDRILPVQKSTLDSAIFYMAALELDSGVQLLSRVDRRKLSDSLAVIYHVLRANGERLLHGNQALAMSNVDSALAINARSSLALSTKSAVLNDLGKLPEALAALDSALAIDSLNAKTRWYRAIIIAKLGRAEEALTSIEPDFKNTADENYFFLVNLKGYLLCMMNRCDEAIAYHDSALALNPKHYFGYLDKAIAQYKLERFEPMLVTLDQADKLVPNQVWVKYNQACIFAKLKKRDEMLAALESSIAIDSSAKQHALQDPDLATYKDDPDFRKLVGLE